MEGESFDNNHKPQENIIPVSPEVQENMINEATNFDMLYDAIDKIGSLQGTKQVYGSLKLKDIIEDVRNGKLDSNYITRTGGLRKKVEDLMKGENSRNDMNLESRQN